MTTIIKKIKKGNPYYYAVETKRVNGQSRIVWQKYLGTLESILARKENSSSICEVDIFEAGGIAAMLQVAKKLQLEEIINSTVTKREQGASVGQYMLLAAINRIFSPCSKLQMNEWYQKCVLKRLWKYPAELFSSQNFWNHMDLISEENIDQIQEKIAIRLKNEYNIDPSMLLYDTTNFFTYVATGNHRNTVAKRGRNKVKRDDLRQVGLALLVSKEFQIPLFHKTYQGNKPDRSLFIESAEDIANFQRKTFGEASRATLVFDKGNISEEAMEKLFIAQQHFVCAIPKNTDNELFSINIEKLTSLPDLPGTKAYSQVIEIWNKKLKAVLAYSESYFTSELVELTESLRKCEQQLQDLQKWLVNGPSRTSNAKFFSQTAIKNKINDIVSRPYMRDIIDVDVTTTDGVTHIKYSINRDQFEIITRTQIGRTLMITSQLDWDEKEVINAYRSQQHIEAAFKLMKNRDYLHWQPSFHWTDQKLKIHSLYCIIALLLATLAHKKVVENGIEISLLQMIEELNDIREVALISNQEKKEKHQKDQIVLSRMSSRQKKLSEVLEIQNVLKI